MILHLWSHWFWITGLVLALLSPNVSAIALNEPLRDPESPRSLTEANVISRTTLSPANNINRSLNQSLNANVEGTINNESRTDAREPKSIPRFNARFAVANSDSPLEPSSVTHPFKASSEVSSTEVISTDLNDSYLVDETSNVSVASNRNPVAYNVDSSNGSKAENGSLLSLTTEAASTITTSTPQLITISKININKVLKGKSPEEKAVKKNITNSINGITLKKILASNKTKQQQVPLNNTSVAVNATQLNTNEFKEVDHTAYQNDSPTLVLEQNRTTDSVQTAKVVPVHVPVKNETEEEDPLFDNSSELSFNSSAENSSASFSTLNQRIFAPEDNALSSFNIVVIVVISAAVVVVTGLVGALSFVMYRRYRWNKPQTLSDKCSNADSSGYIDDSTLRENSEEMYSLDNDSFLNSLEAMTIQNYWTDVKHTKL